MLLIRSINKLLKSKKGISEIISFILIFLISTSLCLGVYFFVKEVFVEEIEEYDYTNLETKFLAINDILEYSTQSSLYTSNIQIDFNYGTISITNTTILYQSNLQSNDTSTICIDLCYTANFDNRAFYINTSPDNISSNFDSLSSGIYLFYFTYDNSTNTHNIEIVQQE